jgi:hypothetical protein
MMHMMDPVAAAYLSSVSINLSLNYGSYKQTNVGSHLQTCNFREWKDLSLHT